MISLIIATVAAAPMQLSHSGRALDAQGMPLQGDQTLTFRLYAGQTGGSAEWTESPTLPLEDGYYTHVFGAAAGNPLDIAHFTDGEVWLTVELPGLAESARQQLLSVPFALHAETAASVSGTTAVLSGPVVRQVERRSIYAIDTASNARATSRDFPFTKHRSDTTVLFHWYDNFRCSGNGVGCRWDVRFRPAAAAVGTAQNCGAPGAIRFDLYNAPSLNIHRPGTVMGTCTHLADGTPLAAGDWVIEVHELVPPAHTHGSPYLGWNHTGGGTQTLMTVEEIY